MKQAFRIALLALNVCAASGPALAAEKYTLYDNFQATDIDPARWQDAERVRSVTGDKLRLMQRYWGATDTDTGTTSQSWSENVTRSGPMTQLRATVRVADLALTDCRPANSSASNARARVIGGFFNTGNRSSSGDQSGDLLAQLWVSRASDSADPQGVLRVGGNLVLCGNSDCSTSTLIGPSVNLGTTSLNTNVVLQVEWDRANRQFLFSRDTSAQTAVAYPAWMDDRGDPAVPFKNVSTRTTVAKCASGPRAYVYIDARFDKVQVNKAAAP